MICLRHRAGGAGRKCKWVDDLRGLGMGSGCPIACSGRRSEGLHTICTCSTSLLHMRELRWLVNGSGLHPGHRPGVGLLTDDFIVAYAKPEFLAQGSPRPQRIAIWLGTWSRIPPGRSEICFVDSAGSPVHIPLRVPPAIDSFFWGLSGSQGMT
jgi:hypothetical protein